MQLTRLQALFYPIQAMFSGLHLTTWTLLSESPTIQRENEAVANRLLRRMEITSDSLASLSPLRIATKKTRLAALSFLTF